MENFKKITENNFEEFALDEYKNWVADRVNVFLLGNRMDYIYELEHSLVDCESPVEQLLALELQELRLEYISQYNPYVDVVKIEKQQEIKCGKNKYRVDFLIPVIYKNQENKCFIVECDGYEFHQKTKEQVEKDNKRQRDLQKEGYEVIRFSGTEIYHRPYQCAMEIKNIILSKCEYNKDE